MRMISSCPVEDSVAVEAFMRRAQLSTFTNPSMLNQALVHCSLTKSTAAGNNSRLEALGDKVLLCVVCSELMIRHPELPHYKLQTYESSYVNNRTLAAVAEELRLAEVLIWERGEAVRERGRQKVLAGSLEALIGAVYKDQGMEAAAAFIRQHILSVHKSNARDSLNRTAVKVLTSILRKSHLPYPSFRLVGNEQSVVHTHEDEYTIEVVCADTVLGTGTASSKRKATRAAAENALQNQVAWQNLTVHEDNLHTVYHVGEKGI